MTTAVVTPVHGRSSHLVRQQASLAAGSTVPDLYVVVAVDDAWPARWRPTRAPFPVVVETAAADGGLPIAAARNAGVRAALAAGADVVVGLDVDCLAGQGLVEAFGRVVRGGPAAVWTGPVTYLPADSLPDPRQLDRHDDPHPGQPDPGPGRVLPVRPPSRFWSLSFAVGAEAWERVGGFCEDYVGYGAEDTDFGRLVGAAGMEVVSTGDARAYHQHHPVSTPPLRHLPDLVRNGRLYARRWGEWPMEGWFRALADSGHVVREGDDWVATAAGLRAAEAARDRP